MINSIEPSASNSIKCQNQWQPLNRQCNLRCIRVNKEASCSGFSKSTMIIANIAL